MIFTSKKTIKGLKMKILKLLGIEPIFKYHVQDYQLDCTHLTLFDPHFISDRPGLHRLMTVSNAYVANAFKTEILNN